MCGVRSLTQGAQGTPWLEDMDRYPNSTIRIDFEGPEVPQEQLYQVLRPVRPRPAPGLQPR